MAQYELLGSKTSPYVRAIRLFIENKVKYDFNSQDIFSVSGNALLESISPIKKIPVFLADKKPIFDSRIIYQYLRSSLVKETLAIEEENFLTEIYTALDTTISFYSMKRWDVPTDQQNFYTKRNLDRLKLINDYLDKTVFDFYGFKYPHMLLFSYIDWAIFREMLSLQNYQNLTKFYEQNKNLPYVKLTDPRI